MLKDKKILYGVPILLVIGAIGLGLLFNKGANQPLNETVQIELGDKVTLKPNQYFKNVKSNDKGYVLKSDLTGKKYDFNAKTWEVKTKNKDFLEVGTYQVKYVKGSEKSLKLTLKVKDTKAPKFVEFPKLIKVEQNAKDLNLLSYFKVKDFSNYSMSINKKNFDISKAGTYEIEVKAVDQYKNTTIKKVKVEVLTSEQAVEKGLTSTVEGETPLSESTQEKVNSGQVNIQSQTSTGQKVSVKPAPQPQPTPQPVPQPQPTPQPVPQPQPKPALDDTIPAGAFRSWAEANAWGLSQVENSLNAVDEGLQDWYYSRYEVATYWTPAGTEYCIVTLYK